VQSRGAARQSIGIALDADIGHRIDAVLAIAMLNGFAAKGEARRIALCVTAPSLKSAQLADVVAGFYANRPAAGPRGGVGGNPDGLVGMPGGTASRDDAPMLAMLARTSADGSTAYHSGIDGPRDTADDAVLIRNMLLAQNDGNAAIVLAGPAAGLVRLLGLYGSRPQIAAKVKHLVVAVGSFPNGSPEPGVAADVAAARTLFAEWPTPIVAVGTEVGTALPYPGSTLDADFAWAQTHPVVDAYRAFKRMPYDAPAAALAATLYAVQPDEGYFGLSEPGTISVQDNGRTQFTAGASGTHRYLKVDRAQRDRVVALYRELVAAKPAPRPTRGRGNAAAAAQQQQQQQPQQQQQQPPPPQPPQADPVAPPPDAPAPRP
jgi:hypothetical protein